MSVESAAICWVARTVPARVEPPGAVRHGDEARSDRLDPAQGVPEVPLALLGLGRPELERVRRLAGREQLTHGARVICPGGRCAKGHTGRLTRARRYPNQRGRIARNAVGLVHPSDIPSVPPPVRPRCRTSRRLSRRPSDGLRRPRRPPAQSARARIRRASAAAAAPGSAASVIARTTTTRRAPASSTSSEIAGVDPADGEPRARRGRARRRSARGRGPGRAGRAWSGWASRGPCRSSRRPASATAASTSASAWVERPISTSSPRTARAAGTGRSPCPRCSTSEPMAWATSARSFTARSAPWRSAGVGEHREVFELLGRLHALVAQLHDVHAAGQHGVEELGEVALPLAGVRAQVEPGAGELVAGVDMKNFPRRCVVGSLVRRLCARTSMERRAGSPVTAECGPCVPRPAPHSRSSGQTASAWARRFTSVPRFSLRACAGVPGRVGSGVKSHSSISSSL